MKILKTEFVAAFSFTLLASVGAAQSQNQTQGPNQGPSRRDMPFPMPPLMRALDANEDGKISTAEIDKAPSVLKKLDKNKDGELSPEELGPPPGRFGRRGRSRTDVSSFESSPMPRTDAEKKILAVLDDMDKNQRRGMMNVPVEDGRLLRLLTESAGAKHVVEIGTSNGYSGIWFSLALIKTGGKLTTFEIDARRASIARENFKRAGVNNIVTLIEGDAHKEATRIKDPIDILFLDADKEGYIDYLDKLLPLVKPGGLILAHNMNTRQADPNYVKAITTNPDLETLFLHMQGAGVGVTLKKR
jgi:predicted O-methyltransferase YrrM